MTEKSNGNVLSGPQVNDDDDKMVTLDSLKSAETLSGGQMKMPETNTEINKEIYAATGNNFNSLMKENPRISSKMLDNAMIDQDQEVRLQKAKD